MELSSFYAGASTPGNYQPVPLGQKEKAALNNREAQTFVKHW
jgi:hypothetical protein